MAKMTDHWTNFVEKIIFSDGCWKWRGATDRKGYGLSWYGKKLWRAPRLSYYLHHQRIDPKLVIMHQCDTPSCVNPLHLSQGTTKENNYDMIKKGRARPFPAKGYACSHVVQGGAS